MVLSVQPARKLFRQAPPCRHNVPQRLSLFGFSVSNMEWRFLVISPQSRLCGGESEPKASERRPGGGSIFGSRFFFPPALVPKYGGQVVRFFHQWERNEQTTKECKASEQRSEIQMIASCNK